MSDNNVDMVRRGFHGFQKLDMDAFVADWARDVVWDVHGYKDWSGTKTQYRGAHEVLAAFASYLGSVRSLDATNLDVTPLEDGRVLGTHHERRLNKGDPEPIHLEIGVVYEFTNDKIARVEVYTGHDEARRAAGLA